MFELARRLRGFAIALVVLAMTAGVAFAASPTSGPRWTPASLDGLFGGSQAGNQDEDASEAPESEAPEDSEAPDESQAVESEAPDASDAPDGSEAPDGSHAPNHGDLVSMAANMATPVGFANHGAFVRCVAHMKDVDATTFDWTTVTPASCADAWGHALKSRGKHGHGHDS